MIAKTIQQIVRNDCKSANNMFGVAFFDQHLVVVLKYGMLLATELTADSEIVELGSYLHDIAAVRDITALPKHPALGAEIARNILQENNYSPERIEHVTKCILSHSAPIQMGDGLPEEICLSNADAMSQIANPAYWLFFAFRIRQLNFDEGRQWLLQRVESNWQGLIEPAKAMIEKEYRLAREILESPE